MWGFMMIMYHAPLLISLDEDNIHISDKLIHFNYVLDNTHYYGFVKVS